MKPLESAVERRFVAKLRKLGIETIKLNLQGNTGWPDRLVLLPSGVPVFIEFKRPGIGKPSARQRLIHRKLIRLGYLVRTFDDADLAVSFVVLVWRSSELPEVVC